MAENCTNLPRKTVQNHHIPTHLLNDLSSRFIINVPEEERVDLIRVCFQIELAHWFYLDFYCEEDGRLPKCALKDFIRIIIRHIPFLQKYASQVDSIIADWREYKRAVPTFGAVLLDQGLQNVLLVQSYVAKASWGFPKGKVNKDELPQHCAIREVLEETGFDITNFIKNEDYLEHYFNEQLIRLYIVTGIPKNAKFHPKTRKEIKSIEWFPLNQLPTGRKDQEPKNNLGSNNFFMVTPFVKPLKKWIASKQSTPEKIEPSFENMSEAEKHVLKQQQLFSQLTKNEMAKYIDFKNHSSPEYKINHPNYSKSNYSPPPRMMRQRNLKQNSENERKQNVHQSPVKGDKSLAKYSSNLYEGTVLQEEDRNLKVLRKDGLGSFFSETWAKFSLDKEALSATFNINLRQKQIIAK
ncbi:m7GpppN-mRNA hydrolase-like [Uloborus diversus]|uniref:m7GpppN-mRNA hydrolase-like n=1 Tax=Uloborus diversus TaxID=327109 RepID=UPI002409A9AE|nr:m7GpppN-mRNA hydrolase-like [Uloborus diversus]XP_054714290.1 m7GpppN-mRNA hydrolase-like [Uloborus diversus]